MKQSQSDQMFKAMRAKGKDVEYVLYPDEGHSKGRPENELDMRCCPFDAAACSTRALPAHLMAHR